VLRHARIVSGSSYRKVVKKQHAGVKAQHTPVQVHISVGITQIIDVKVHIALAHLYFIVMKRHVPVVKRHEYVAR
jgi:hypothetical protein